MSLPEKRRKDLEDKLNEAYKLLSAIESKLLVESNPVEKAKLNQQMAEIKRAIELSEEELNQLPKYTGIEPSPEKLQELAEKYRMIEWEASISTFILPDMQPFFVRNSYEQVFLRVFNKKDNNERVSAIQFLICAPESKISQLRKMELILDRLDEKNPNIRIWLIKALAIVGSRKVIKRLSIIKMQDDGIDKWGESISQVAEEALLLIEEREKNKDEKQSE